jgi:membrane-associated phospholipid phosphatase
MAAYKCGEMLSRCPWPLFAPVLAVVTWAGSAGADVPAPGTLPVEGQPVGTGLPRRHEGKKLEWDPSFNRMDEPEIILTAAAAAVALAGAIAPPLKTGWTGGILFDDSARNTLRLSSYQARLDIRDASDVGLAVMTTFPILVDSALLAYWYRGSDDVALQMTLIDAEAISISAAVQGAANFFTGRARPYVQDCGGAVSSNSTDCNNNPSEYRSFFSGHSAISFTSAGLICAHHLRLHLFESAADTVTCAAAFVAAAGVATMRVMGDMHYASDVITGAIVGTSVGLGVPLLHHYAGHEVGPDGTSGVTLHIVPMAFGAALGGTF